MTNLSLNSNPNLTNFAVPKLHDNRSNWADYSSQIQKAIGSKGLWRHVEGNVVMPKPYMLVDGVLLLQMGRPQLLRNRLRYGKHESLLITKNVNISCNMLSF